MGRVFKRLPRKFFNVIMDNSSDSVMILSKDYRILWANKKMIDSTGLSSKNVLGSFCHKITHRVDQPCSPPNDVCPIFELLAKNKQVSVVHKHFDHKGDVFYVRVTAIPVKNFWGELSHFVHIARDIPPSEVESADKTDSG